ncbi:MAG: diol dehydratase small subunit [Caldilineaceae bacterium]
MAGNGKVKGVHYPLMDDAENLTAASGRTADGVTLEHLAELSPEDLRISDETLRAQATVAAQSGFAQLAENLTRAAELTKVPNEELLMMYEKMRPGRATLAEMVALADRLEQAYEAKETAMLVREAAAVYQSESY